MTETGKPLTGRTALVTGAGSGLGRAISLALGAAGAKVILVGRTEETLHHVRAELDRRLSNRVEVCDVRRSDEIRALANRVENCQVSILVNNAGIAGPVADLVDVEADAWDETFAVNVRGVYLMCRAFLPGMMARGAGDVVNLASVTGKRPLRARTPYAASKMAVLGLTTSLAWEVGGSGVRVNCLSPGPVHGPRMDRNFKLEAARAGTTPEQAQAEFVNRAALGRMVTEAEVGQAVVAMLQIPAMTGADVDLSAGMVAR